MNSPMHDAIRGRRRQPGTSCVLLAAWLMIVAAVRSQEPDTSKGTGQEPSTPSLGELLLGPERLKELREKKAAVGSRIAGSEEPDVPLPSDAVLAARKVRKLDGTYITLLTDVPSQVAVDELPRVFDRAVPQWASYFRLDLAKLQGWKVTACLIQNREPFESTGLFPTTLPPFRWGFQRGNQLWWYEQETDYYRRHLMLHEGVHALMRDKLGGTGPPWYREGIAERLATHRWWAGNMTVGLLPKRREDVPGWGRIDALRRGFDAGQALMIRDVMKVDASVFQESEPYAWCWAATTFLENHPAFRIRFRRMLALVSDETLAFNTQLERQYARELRELDEQWQLFVAEADYGYDFQRAAVHYAAGKPLPPSGGQAAILADRGWQSTGFRLEKGRTYIVTAKGQFQIARERRQPWMCEPSGVTLRYHRGNPLGMLLGQIRLDEPEPGPSNLISPVPVALRRRIRPVESGTLYLVINDHPAERHDNRGGVVAEVRELP